MHAAAIAALLVALTPSPSPNAVVSPSPAVSAPSSPAAFPSPSPSPVLRPTPPPTPAPLPAIALVIRVAPPAAPDAVAAAAEIGRRAAADLGDVLHALRTHPYARVSIAVTPAYLDALVRAAAWSSPGGRTTAALLADLRAAIARRAVELIAVPDGEPVLPLLVDAGGKSSADPHIVMVGARADAEWAMRDAIRRVAAFAGQPGCGLYSPYGAYDDETAFSAHAAGARFALFSDRAPRAAGGGSDAAFRAAAAAALHAYALAVDKGVTLPTVFWSQADSDDVESAAGTASAAGELAVARAHAAAAREEDANPHLLIVRVDAGGAWAQRSDARDVVNHLIAAIGARRAGESTTIGAFLQAHPPKDEAYGFPPDSETGSLALWMGSSDQASLWHALAAARAAAGGDAALTRTETRTPLLAAEAGRWFSATELPLPVAAIQERLDQFRALLTALYRGAGVTAPSPLAPVTLARPAPPPPAIPKPPASPGPTPTASPQR